MNIKRKMAGLVGNTFIPDVFNMFYQKTKIVFYHGVEIIPVENSIIQSNQILFSEFKRQILFLRKKFEIISIDEFYLRFTNERLSGKEVVITFDDGYKNNLTVVAPFLGEHGIPFTVFICPELIDKAIRLPTYYVRMGVYSKVIDELSVPFLNKKFGLTTENLRNEANNELIDIIKTSNNDDVNKIITDIKDNFSVEQLTSLNDLYHSEELMTWSEVIELKENFSCTIASHGLDHAILHSVQTNEIIDNQLELSKKRIIEEIKECKYFAFPNGNIDSVSTYSVQKSAENYDLGFAVNGSAVSYNDHYGYVSRLSLSPFFNEFKVQILILANIN
ncbi:polysaccharide deacetylase family protein [Aequorivita capsosiphonis]|uniref:polysaccharide deacetylase family protein n=1 Tax=Aequorivita capsosiphonis TaxID=487317 RepID=UPI00047D7FA4|nr:polysaccharide deacetylase family protein [Aequorivita capsosiphonis]